MILRVLCGSLVNDCWIFSPRKMEGNVPMWLFFQTGWNHQRAAIIGTSKKSCCFFHNHSGGVAFGTELSGKIAHFTNTGCSNGVCGEFSWRLFVWTQKTPKLGRWLADLCRYRKLVDTLPINCVSRWFWACICWPYSPVAEFAERLLGIRGCFEAWVICGFFSMSTFLPKMLEEVIIPQPHLFCVAASQTSSCVLQQWAWKGWSQSPSEKIEGAEVFKTIFHL